MRGYDRYDEYEDLDEYEDDGDEQEEEDAGEDAYEEEEDPKPAKEVLDYLALRERLKEEKRKKLKKELGTANGSYREKRNVISKDTYGSFFGPSQPGIAQRVIEESKSLLENPNLAAKVLKSNQIGSKSSVSASSAPKSQVSGGHRPKVTNGLQKKVEMLKNTRDYSFLLSEDAELPAPKKVPQSISAPKPEARAAQLSERSRDSVTNNGKKVSGAAQLSERYRDSVISNGKRVSLSHDDRKPTGAINRMQLKVEPERFGPRDMLVRSSGDARKLVSRNNGTLADHRKQPSVSKGSRPGVPPVSKSVASKPISNGSGPGRPVVSKIVLPKPISNGSGPGRPVLSKSVPPKPSVSSGDKRVLVSGARTSASGTQTPTSKVHTSFSKQSCARREEYPVPGKPKILSKQLPQSKHKQVMRPATKPAARDASRERPMRGPFEDDDDVDPVDPLSWIRGKFKYNPSKYADSDDDSDMEANYDDILREERRSERIAKQEDEEELRKIEEEERRERLRKEAKKRKLSHR